MAATTTSHDAEPKVLALYPDFPRARHAIEVLAAHGVEGDDLALVDEAAIEEPTTPEAQADPAVSSHVELSIAVVVIIGGAAAAALGAAMTGLEIVLWPGGIGHGWWTFGLVTAWFAAAGSLIGVFIGAARTTQSSEWQRTFGEQPDEPIWLAIYGDVDPDEVALDETSPLEVRHAPMS